jgi:hypothetical protein
MAVGGSDVESAIEILANSVGELASKALPVNASTF